jgi:subtilisin
MRFPRLCILALLVLANSAASARAQGQNGTVPVLIRFNERPGQAQADLVSQHGGTITRQFNVVPAVAARIPAAAADALRNAPGIAAVEPDGVVNAHGEYDVVWGVNKVNAPSVHSGTWIGPDLAPQPIRGLGIRVAVLDTGIDYTHPDLWANYSGGYDFVNNDSDPRDDQGHGTHVSGTIAALLDGAGVVGVAPEVDLYGVKVLSSSGSGSWSSIIAGIDWSINNGMHVLNLSLGSSSDPGTTVRAAFDNAYAAGLVVLASAGNSGPGTDTVGYPAKYSSVIAVASTTSTDAISSFSSTGPAVEVAAPGSSIYSTLNGGGYGYMSGTSMACPHAAGVAALILAAGVADGNGDGRRNDEARWILGASARDLGTAGRDNVFGLGLIDASAAVYLAWNPDGPEPPPTPIFNAPSGLTATVSGTTVSLTWLDNSNCETGFELQYGLKTKSSVAWGTPIALAANTTTTSVSPGNGSWLFRVRAVNGGQVTAWSGTAGATVGSKGGGRK